MSETKERYLVFDTDKDNLAAGLFLNKTTKKHVCAVSEIQAKNKSLSDESRAKYARQAGLFRKDPNTKIEDLFDSYTAAAALAEVLFKGCPKLLDSEGEIINQELFECLDEGIVNRAFLDFQMRRSGTKNVLQN